MIPSFLNMLSWWQWLILGAVPPLIVLLYFLKLKRQPVEVPSTYLWHKSIEDLRVNSIWQRLRQNLLLFLQLLLIALAMLALLRPYWRGTALTQDRLIFLVDNSASMSATDVAPTRLEDALRQVRELIDQMKSGDQAMVISFSDTAQVVQEFTDNRRQLRRRLETIQPTHRSTSLTMALKLAAGLANPGQSEYAKGDSIETVPDMSEAEAMPATMYIFSDGKFEDVSGFSLGNLTPVFVPIGKPETGNVGITAFSTRRHESRPDQIQAFGQLQNFSPGDKTLTVELLRDGSLVDASQVTLPAGESRGVVFDLANVERGVLELHAQTGDALPVDDRAFAAVNPPRRGRVLLVTPGNRALEWALSTGRAADMAEVRKAAPDLLETEAYQREALTGAYDLIIYDQCRPKAMPLSNTLFIGQVPPGAGWQEEGDPQEKVVRPQVIDTQRSHPLMQLVEVDNIDIAESYALAPPPGSTVLVDSSRGKIMAIGPRDGFEDVVIGFEIFGVDAEGAAYANTNWPLRLSFPTFWFNALEYLGGRQLAHASAGIRPGEIVKLRSDQADSIEVVAPGGRRERLVRGKDSEFSFHGADEVGVYQVYEGDRLVQRFSVNLFDPRESDIALPETSKIKLGYVEVEGQRGLELRRREAWKPLLLLALGVLLVEWYVYNRRVYI